MQENNPIPVVTPQVVAEQPKQSNFLTILLSVLLIISVSISGFFAYQTQKLARELQGIRSEEKVVATSKPSIEPVATNSAVTVDPTANWKLINSKHWTFKVPKEWYFIKCLSGTDIILGPNLNKEFRDVSVECNFGIRDFLSVNRMAGNYSIPITTSPDQNGIYTVVTNKKNIVVDKQNAIQQTEEVHGNPEEGTHTIVYFKHENYTDSLMFWDSDKNAKKETIEQILSIFKFLD